MNRIIVISFVLFAGCSSLVDDYCARGHVRDDGTCVVPASEVDGGVAFTADARMAVENMDPDPVPAPPDAMPTTPDAAPDALVVDAAPDALVADAAPTPDGPTCSADMMTDPDHCGSCTHSCASGICTAGHCAGEPWGHIVAIGHDYASYHPAQRRVLVNAVALGASSDVAVAWFPGESQSMTHVAALTSGMSTIGRAWHEVAFPADPTASFGGIDVVIVPPDHGDGDTAESAGAEWASALDAYLRTGGVVVVLDGASGVNYRFAHGAQLFDVGAPVVVTGQPTAVVDGTDAIADQVIAPYLAEATSVSWPGALQSVVTTMGGVDTIVFHVAR